MRLNRAKVALKLLVRPSSGKIPKSLNRAKVALKCKDN